MPKKLKVAWFLCPYPRRDVGKRVSRYCVMDDFTTQFAADGGAWGEIETAGDKAVVKVRAEASTLATLSQRFKKLGNNFGTDKQEQDATIIPRRKPRYDAVLDKIVFDGEEIPFDYTALDALDKKLVEDSEIQYGVSHY
jgi:hypothetical protein